MSFILIFIISILLFSLPLFILTAVAALCFPINHPLNNKLRSFFALFVK